MSAIAKGAIKLSYIQTAPGEELKIKSALEKACKNDDAEVENYLFLKGLGSFDIILICLVKDFTSSLTKAGPIDGILKSNILFCYPYLQNPPPTIFKRLKGKNFTAFCSLKINPELKIAYPDLDLKLREILSKNSNCSILGTLGWNEVLVLISENSPYKVLETLNSFTSLVWLSNGTEYTGILKTFSFLAVNYDILPKDKKILDAGFTSTKKHINKKSNLEEYFLNNSGSPTSTINITLKPLYHEKIKAFFKEKNLPISII